MTHHPGKGRGVRVKTFSMTRLPPKRVTNSAGEATVKSRCRSIFLCSRPLFARCSPDMLGLRRDATAVSKLAGRRANPRLTCCRWLRFPGGVGSASSSGRQRPDFAPSAVSSKESNKTLHPADAQGTSGSTFLATSSLLYTRISPGTFNNHCNTAEENCSWPSYMGEAIWGEQSMFCN